MKNIDNIVTILHKEKNNGNINKLEEIEILKEATSQNIDVINGRNDPLYELLLPIYSWNSTRRQA